MKRFRVIKLTAVLALLLAGSNAIAEESTGRIYVQSTTIDDRFESKREEPSSVAVIGGDEVDAAHGENLQDMLQAIPGITSEVQAGDSVKIHIRGVENQRYMGEKPGVAVVIDGVPVFERTGSVNIDIDNIESIKVIKGGASYLFGEDALSGAVIITTKRGAKMAGVKATAEAGSFGYMKALARFGKANEKMSGHIQASERKTDGYYDQGSSKADYVNGKLQYYITDTSDLSFGFEISEREKDSHGTVKGATAAEENPESNDLGDGMGRDYTRMYDVSLGKYFLTYANDIGEDSNLMLNLYQFGDNTAFVSRPQKYDADGNAVVSPDAYVNGNDYKQTQQGLKGEWRSGGESLAYLAALDIRRNQYNNKTHYLVDHKTSSSAWASVNEAGTQTGDNTTDETMNAVYGEVKFRPLADTTLTFNGRMDQIRLDYSDALDLSTLEREFNVSSWRMGVNYNITNSWDVYGSGSTGFRTPTVSQLFTGQESLTETTAGNPDLKPETALNMEIGMRGITEMLGNSLEIDAAVFQLDREDFILSTSGQYASADTGETEEFQNIGGVQNRGLELAVTSDRSKMVSANLAYTYLDAKFSKYENYNQSLGESTWSGGSETMIKHDLTGNVVPRTPNHHVNLTANVRATEDLLVSAEMDKISSYYADEMNAVEIEGRTTYNLLANYDLAMAGGKWSIFARIDNVLDDQYYNNARGGGDTNEDGVFDEEDISISVNPGRKYTAGVSAEF